jgi:hypothetical protein
MGRTVGSSSVKMPQLKQNVSASAKRITMHASTRCPALHRPRMSSAVSPLRITTCENMNKQKQQQAAAATASSGGLWL